MLPLKMGMQTNCGKLENWNWKLVACLIVMRLFWVLSNTAEVIISNDVVNYGPRKWITYSIQNRNRSFFIYLRHYELWHKYAWTYLSLLSQCTWGAVVMYSWYTTYTTVSVLFSSKINDCQNFSRQNTTSFLSTWLLCLRCLVKKFGSFLRKIVK